MTASIDLRRLTEKGLDAFRGYLESLRAGSDAAPPFALLTAADTSRPVSGAVSVALQRFDSRLEAGRFFHGLLADVASDAVESDVGLWSWLSLFYFDQVCPPGPTGLRKPGRDYRHILEPGYPNGHRHLLGGAHLVYTVYDCGEAFAPLMLYTPLHTESQFCHELVSRQSFITNRGIVEAAVRLYLDPRTQKPKRGAQVRKDAPGTLYRFIDVIQQLDVNYDLYSMTGAQIIELLPAEFADWVGRQRLVPFDTAPTRKNVGSI